MAQPNVVREPSMDEILASIRRIIESNEPISQSGVATGQAEPEGFSGNAANDDSDAVPLTVDASFTDGADMAGYAGSARGQEPRAAVSMMEMPYDTSIAHAGHVPTAEPVPQKALSLADVAARVRAASERNVGLKELSPREIEVEDNTNPLVTSRMNFSGTSQSAYQPVAEPDYDVPALEIHDGEHIAEPDLAHRAQEYAAAPEQEASAMPLLSGNTGEQVARSFQDLALAIDQAERRSFDDIAADLLRPMLQEWLDDNLPTLVERLVREEIERVARGSRR